MVVPASDRDDSLELSDAELAAIVAAAIAAAAALIALGYRPLDANRMARAADDGTKTSEEIIRAALRGVA